MKFHSATLFVRTRQIYALSFAIFYIFIIPRLKHKRECESLVGFGPVQVSFKLVQDYPADFVFINSNKINLAREKDKGTDSSTHIVSKLIKE